MGNLKSKFKKFPRPIEINFPEVKKNNWDFSVCSQREGTEKKLASSFCLLKSGNILISYKVRDEKNFKVKSYLETYNVPDLKLVEKFDYYEEEDDDDMFYVLDFAHQLKNGNIFTIGDKLYIFDGEGISKGPKEKSEEIKNIYFYTANVQFAKFLDEFERKQKIINKRAKVFYCDFLLEVKENIFLYTEGSLTRRETIFLLDISESKVEKSEMFYTTTLSKFGQPWNYKLDIILQSEYYPENLYILANIELPGDIFNSILFVFNLEQFLKQNNPTKEPLFRIDVSNSQNIMALCEYDKKYILLDSYANGIYIIDMESKQKVAVCVPKLYLRDSNSFYNNYSDRRAGNGSLYKKMIKLKDGQVLLETCYIADIREQICEQKIRNLNFFRFELFGDFLIFYFHNTSIYIFKIEQKD